MYAPYRNPSDCERGTRRAAASHRVVRHCCGCGSGCGSGSGSDSDSGGTGCKALAHPRDDNDVLVDLLVEGLATDMHARALSASPSRLP